MSDKDRHLVLAYRPGWQSVDDLHAIAGHVRDIEPGIGVFVVPTTIRNSVSRKAAGRRPTLIVSAGPLGNFRPLRGKVYQGRRVPKIEQVRRLAAAGVAVPKTAVLTPDLALDPATWGPFVVVKPTDLGSSSRGNGINLFRTERVRYRSPESYASGHPGRLGPMLVQRFIDTGERLVLFRVLTFFGEPLYCQMMRSRRRHVDLTATDDVIESAIVANQAVDEEETFVSDPDVVALAREAHNAIPEVPLKGCDIIREAGTGKLYVLETNPGGNTWHFSSDFLAAIRQQNGPQFERQRIQQFDAFRTAARVLVKATLAEAT